MEAYLMVLGYIVLIALGVLILGLSNLKKPQRTHPVEKEEFEELIDG
ncbi:MAG: hypothetical protein ACOYD7_07310 [Raoultibacter sp.]